MENNVLLNSEQALGADQILKVTALLYLKEALVTQQYETCRELINTAKNLGVGKGEINAVIAEYLSAKGPAAPGPDADNPDRQKGNRLDPY